MHRYQQLVACKNRSLILVQCVTLNETHSFCLITMLHNMWKQPMRDGLMCIMTLTIYFRMRKPEMLATTSGYF